MLRLREQSDRAKLEKRNLHLRHRERQKNAADWKRNLIMLGGFLALAVTILAFR
jgi:hypothetical protein